jgi:hypothetical protein
MYEETEIELRECFLLFGAESFVFQFTIKKINIKTYRTIIFPAVFYGSEIWSLTLNEEHTPSMLENGVRWDKVTGEWRRLHNEELHDLCSSPNIIWMIKSRRMRQMGHVACMGEKRRAQRVLMGKPEGKGTLERPRPRQDANIKMVLEEMGWGHGLD